MKSNIIEIGLGIICISIIIYLVKNYKSIELFWNKIKEKKVTTIVSKIFTIVVICSAIYYIYALLLLIGENVEFYRYESEADVLNDYNDKRIIEEYKFYSNVIKNEYENQNPQNPYIPEGFSYVKGEWNTGFVIQDKDENQYVWVPCTNKDDINIAKLEKNNFSNNPFISKDICIDEGSEEFITSALENGGFYISRYEIGKENDLPVSKSGVDLISNITRNEAKEIVSQMYKDNNFSCTLINGYAYDTTLSWIINSNDISVNKIKDQSNIKTGREKYNNIYDFIDNVFEITNESSFGTVIIRGFLFSEEETQGAYNYINKLDIKQDGLSRLSISEEDNYYTLEHIIGFRTIIYK